MIFLYIYANLLQYTMKKLSYFFLFILLFFNTSCKDSISGCVDASANNYNPSATINDECCYNCYTSLGYSLGEFCNYNLDFILENEFNGLIQCYSINGDVVPHQRKRVLLFLTPKESPCSGHMPLLTFTAIKKIPSEIRVCEGFKNNSILYLHFCR